jgi:hypothetical protein
MLSEVVAFCQFFFFLLKILFHSLICGCLFVCLFVFAAKRDGGLWDPRILSAICVCACLFCGYFHNKNTKVSK